MERARLNLHVAQSPLQVLNCAEAAEAFPAERNDLVLIHKEDGPGRRQVEAVIGLYPWNRIIRVDYAKGPGILRLLKQWALVHRLRRDYRGKVDRLFIGEFRNAVMNYVRTSLKAGQTILCDDGTATMTVQATYFQKGVFFTTRMVEKKAPPTLLKRLREALFRPFFDAGEARRPIDLFTVYKLEPVPGQRIFRNSYAYLQGLDTLPGDIPPEGSLYYGGKYSEAGLISREEELRVLALIRQDAETRFSAPMIYIPHRGDDPAKLAAIAAQGITVSRSDLPAEVVLVALRGTGRMILGLQTSVLGNAVEIVGARQVAAYRLPTEMIDPRIRATIEKYYDDLRSSGVEVIETA